MDERLKKQLAFALEIDKEKNILRQTHLSGHGRRENDAEHAWHTYAYDEEGLKSQKEREERAKEKLYSLLPDDQKRELVSLFDEFESYGSPEARFAHAMDNVQPLILNDSNEGGDWKDHQVSAELVYGRHKKTKLGSEKLYEVSDEILQKNIKKGNLKE